MVFGMYRRSEDPAVLDRILDESRQFQEQFYGPRYWERPRETPSGKLVEQ